MVAGSWSAPISVGSTESMVGAGLPIVTLRASDSPPPGFGLTTLTESTPALARTPNVKDKLVESINVVSTSAPSTSTTDVGRKFRPLATTLAGKASKPSNAGSKASSTGAGFCTVRLPPSADPPPNDGFVAPIASSPGDRRQRPRNRAVQLGIADHTGRDFGTVYRN